MCVKYDARVEVRLTNARTLAAAAGVFGFVTSLFFLLLTPTSLMDFEIEGTSRELAPAFLKKIRQRVKGVATGDVVDAATGGSWIVSELQIMCGLSTFAGIITGRGKSTPSLPLFLFIFLFTFCFFLFSG